MNPPKKVKVGGDENVVDDEQEVVSPQEKEKQDWARQMRLKFTKAEMRDEEGNLNLE